MGIIAHGDERVKNEFFSEDAVRKVIGFLNKYIFISAKLYDLNSNHVYFICSDLLDSDIDESKRHFFVELDNTCNGSVDLLIRLCCPVGDSWFDKALYRGRYRSRKEMLGSLSEDMGAISNKIQSACRDLNNFVKSVNQSKHSTDSELRESDILDSAFFNTESRDFILNKLRNVLECESIGCKSIWGDEVAPTQREMAFKCSNGLMVVVQANCSGKPMVDYSVVKPYSSNGKTNAVEVGHGVAYTLGELAESLSDEKYDILGKVSIYNSLEKEGVAHSDISKHRVKRELAALQGLEYGTTLDECFNSDSESVLMNLMCEMFDSEVVSEHSRFDMKNPVQNARIDFRLANDVTFLLRTFSDDVNVCNLQYFIGKNYNYKDSNFIDVSNTFNGYYEVSSESANSFSSLVHKLKKSASEIQDYVYALQRFESRGFAFSDVHDDDVHDEIRKFKEAKSVESYRFIKISEMMNQDSVVKEIVALCYENKVNALRFVLNTGKVDITLAKAREIGIPVSRLSKRLSLDSHNGMYISNGEYKNKAIYPDISDDEGACKLLTSLKWEQ